MKIILSPQSSDYTSTVGVNGLVLSIDGQEVDLSVIPIGGEAEGTEPLIGIVTRDEVKILYRYDSSKAESDQPMDIESYTFIVENGEVPCPIIWKQEQPVEVVG